MLDDLDDIPWSALEHAYGDAEDIPNIIRALVSRDPDEREWAQEMLEMGPFHQGSLYSCTPFVARCLLRLAQQPDTPDTPWMLQFISRMLATTIWILTEREAIQSDVEQAIAEQMMGEIRAQLLSLVGLFDHPDMNIRISLLRLLTLMQADLLDLASMLTQKLDSETEASLRAATVFCLSQVRDGSTSSKPLTMLADSAESPLARIAAGFGVLSAMKARISDKALADFCGVIATRVTVLEQFEEVYSRYLEPLGAPSDKDRLLDCLPDGLTAIQRDHIIQALMHMYSQLPKKQSFGIRIGYGYYLATMIRFAFPAGKLSPATTIYNLTATQRLILEAFQQYDMPSFSWNVYGTDDFRSILGLDCRYATDFLDFMTGKRSAR